MLFFVLQNVCIQLRECSHLKGVVHATSDDQQQTFRRVKIYVPRQSADLLACKRCCIVHVQCRPMTTY